MMSQAWILPDGLEKADTQKESVADTMPSVTPEAAWVMPDGLEKAVPATPAPPVTPVSELVPAGLRLGDSGRMRQVLEESALQGVSTDVADTNLAELQQARTDDMRLAACHESALAIDRNLPRTQEWYAKQGAAAVSATMDEMENQGFFERLYNEHGLADRMGFLSLEAQGINLRRLYGTERPEDNDRYKAITAELNAYANARKDENFALGAYRSFFQTLLPQMMVGAEKGLSRGLQAGLAAAAVTVLIGPGAAATPITAGSAFGAGFIAGSAEHSFEMAAAEAYGNITDIESSGGQKVDRDVARLLAVVAALPNAGLEMASLGTFVKAIPGMGNLFSRLLTPENAQAAVKAIQQNPSIFRAVGEGAAKFLKSYGVEISTEVAQEAVNIGAEEIAKGISGNGFDAATLGEVGDRLLETGVEAAKTFAIPGVGVGTVNTIASYRTQRAIVERAQADRAALQNLVQASQNSKLVQEAPSVAEDFIANATGGKNLFVSPRAAVVLFQSAEGQAVAQRLGWTEDIVLDALETGADVPVPVSKASVHLFNTEFWPVMEAETRLRADGANQTEAEALAAGDPAAMANSLGDFMSLIDEVNADADRRTQWESWTETLGQQLEQAGYKPGEVSVIRDVFAAHAEKMAPLFGMEPDEWLTQGLAGIEYMAARDFNWAMREFLQTGTTFAELKEAHESARQTKAGVQETPLVQLLAGTLDRRTIRKEFGQDYVRAIEQRYGRKFLTNGLRDKTGKEYFRNDSAVQAAVDAGFLPKGTLYHEAIEHLAYGRPIDEGKGRALFQAGNNLDQNDAASTKIIGEVRNLTELAKAVPYTISTRTSRSGKTSWQESSILFKDLHPSLQAAVKAHLKIDNPEAKVSDLDIERSVSSQYAKMAKELAKTQTVQNMHKRENLDFESIDVSVIRNSSAKKLIHKSKSHNKRQSSEYYAAIIDGRPAYVRISNHWGTFFTNVYWNDADAKTRFPDYDWENNPYGDQFGRVGANQHNWELNGGKKNKDGDYASTSQAGVIWLDNNNAKVLYQLDQTDEAMQPDRLVALHNLSEANLLFADSLGGLAVPSLGVTKADTPYSNFGSISLIGTKDMVNPSETPVFSADAYSARFPRPIWGEVKASAWKAFNNKFKDAFAAVGDDNALANILHYMGENADRDRALNVFVQSPGAKAAYLKEQGKTFEVVTSEATSKVDGAMDAEVMAAAKEILEKTESRYIDYADIPVLSKAYAAFIERDFQEDMAAAGDSNFKMAMAEKTRDRRLEMLDENGNLPFGTASRLFEATLEYAKKAGKREIDYYATRAMLKELVSDTDSDFLKFAQKEVAERFDTPKIQLGRKKVPMTLENVVSAMTSNTVKNEENTFATSLGQIQAAASKRFVSMEDMQEARDNIVSPKEEESIELNLKEQISTYVENLVQYSEWPNSPDLWDDAKKTLVEAAKKKKITAATMKAAMKKYGFKDVSSYTVETGIEILKEIKKGYVSYFEAKPQRAVRLREFAGAVVPDNITQVARRILQDAGLVLKEYAADDDTAREKAITDLSRELQTQLGNILFQNGYVTRKGEKIETARGAFVLRPEDGRAMIALFKGKRDISTIIHEGAGHFFLENLRAAAQLENTPEWVRQDWQTVAEAIGADPNPMQDIGDVAHEKFARMAVEYFRQGKAPSTALERAFRKFARWLGAIYRAARRAFDFEEISPEVRSVFDRLLASEADIAAANRALDSPDVLAPKGVKQDKWDTYRTLLKRAKDDAEAAAMLARLGEQRRVEREARIEADVLLTSDKNFQLLEKWREAGGIRLEDVEEQFGDETTELLVARWRESKRKALFKKDGTLSLDDVLGDIEGEDMLQALSFLLYTPTRKEFRQQVIDNRLAEWEANRDPGTEALASRSADAALKAKAEALTNEVQPDTDTVMQEADTRAASMTLEALDSEYEALKAADKRRVAASRQMAADIMADREKEIAKHQAALDKVNQKLADARYTTRWTEAEQKLIADIRVGKEQEKLNRQREKLQALKAEYQEKIDKAKQEIRDAKYTARWMDAEGRLVTDMRVGQVREKMRRMLLEERTRRAALGAAWRARLERDRIKNTVRKLTAGKKMEPAFQAQIRAIAARFKGLGTAGMVAAPDTPSLRDFLSAWAIDKGMSAENESPALPPVAEWLLSAMDGGRETYFNKLTLEQMRDVQKAVRMLAHMSRSAQYLMGQMRQADINATVRELIAPMQKQPEYKHLSERDKATLWGKMLSLLRGSTASKTIMRYLFKAADGYVSHGKSLEAGPNERILQQPFNQAASEAMRLRKQYADEMKRILAPLTEQRDLLKPFKIEGVYLPDDVSRAWGGLWDMEKVFSVALNMGNAGNINAIKSGYSLEDADLTNITKGLTTEQWQAVQQIWDMLETLYPRLNAVHEALYGVPLRKVETQSLTVNTSDGQVLELRGGYYPLIFDRQFSEIAAEREDAEAALNSFEAIMRKPEPKSGMTKERKGGKLPPRLSLSVLGQHVQDSIHYATHTLPLHNTYALIKDARYKAAFERAFGQENYAQLLPWLRGIARPEVKLHHTGDRIIDWLTKRGTFTVLAFSARTALLGFTSVWNSLRRVGFGNFAKAAAAFASSPLESWRMVRNLSPYMRDRATNMDRDIARLVDQFNPGGNTLRLGPFALDKTRYSQAAFAMITAVDALITYPTWLAQFRRAEEAGKSMEEAVTLADTAVFESQAGGGVVDMSQLMRSPGMMRILTVFMTFASNQFNRQLYYYRGFMARMKGGATASEISFGEFCNYLLLEILAPAATTAILFSLLQKGELPEGEDIAEEIWGLLICGLPLLRLFDSAVKFGSRAGGSMGATRGITAAGDAVRQGMGLVRGDRDAKLEAFIRSAVNAAGFIAAMPTVQMFRTFDGLKAYDKGKAGPAAFLLGPPPKERN